jgi:putative transposase
MPAIPPARLPASPRASPAAPAASLLVPPPTGSSADSAVRRDRTEKIALFRYQLIRAAADAAVTTRQRGPMVRDLAAVVHPGPFGGTVTVSKDTIDRWIRDWRRGGFDALKPRGRAQGAVTPAQILSLAATLKRERPARTSAQVRRIMIDTLGDAPSESTLLRHFRTLELPTGVREVFGRFEADYPNEMWVGDGLHGPRINGRKTYLFAFLDDHTRVVTAGRWAYAEDSVRLTAALRPALEARGIPGTIYVDNGSAFVDESLSRTCARLGIRLTHSKPYRPQGRGKIERFFNTVNSQFLTEISVVDTVTGVVDAGVGSMVTSLDELNALFTSWVEMVYHQAVHSTTGQTPLHRWDASASGLSWFMTPSTSPGWSPSPRATASRPASPCSAKSVATCIRKPRPPQPTAQRPGRRTPRPASITCAWSRPATRAPWPGNRSVSSKRPPRRPARSSSCRPFRR